MLLKIPKQMLQNRLVLSKLVKHFLNGMSLPSPIQCKPNKSLIPFYCGLKPINEAINGVNVIHHKSPILHSLKLLQPRKLPPLLPRNTKRRRGEGAEPYYSMYEDDGGNDNGAGSDGNEAEGAARGAVAEEADSRVALTEVALDVALEVGEVVAEAVEAGERERILFAVKLEEELVGAVALRLGERRCGGGEDGEEVRERRVEVAGAVDAAAEAEAEVGGGFAVVEVGGDEAREVALRFCFREGFVDAVRVGLEDLGEDVAVVRVLVVDVVDLRWGLDHGPDLVVGVGLQSAVELARDVWACGRSVFFEFLRRVPWETKRTFCETFLQTGSAQSKDILVLVLPSE